MSLQALPNYPRGVLILDLNYYTSSVFVEPMRSDIQGLLEDFSITYSSSPPPRRVFAIFKDIWSGRGWEFLHLCAIDDVVRDTFLITVFRLFIERMNEQERVIMRVGALFGLYTAYFSQPTSQCRVQHHIPIPIDTYSSFKTLFTSLPNDAAIYTTYILSKLLTNHAFLILPDSSTSPYSPCKLPHAVIQEIDPMTKKKTGRKTKRDKELMALGGLRSLEALVAVGSDEQVVEDEENYLKAKEDLMNAVPPDVIQKAEEETLQRMREIDMSIEADEIQDKQGLLRVEEAVRSGEGLLHLLRGTKSNSMLVDEY